MLTKAEYDFICQKFSAFKPSNKDLISTKGTAIETTTNQGKPDILWVSCNGYCLYTKNKQQLHNGRQLTDKHINGAQALLKMQYPKIDGLQSTAILSQPDNTIQIIHVQPQHWAVIYPPTDVQMTLLSYTTLCIT